jgi:hypothetical protein
MVIGCTRITGPSQIGTSSRDIFSQYNSDILMIYDAMGAYYVFNYIVSFVISPIHYGNRNATISGRRTSTCTRVRVPLLQGRSALTTHYLPDTQNQTDDSSTYTPALLCLLLPASFPPPSPGSDAQTRIIASRTIPSSNKGGVPACIQPPRYVFVLREL